LVVSIINDRMNPIITKAKHPKKPRGMPEWFKQWSENVYNKNINEQQKFNFSLEQRVTKIEIVLNKHSEILTKHSEVLERNNLH
jgi:hypothetical protein